jgi:hypothetical protein
MGTDRFAIFDDHALEPDGITPAFDEGITASGAEGVGFVHGVAEVDVIEMGLRGGLGLVENVKVGRLFTKMITREIA